MRRLLILLLLLVFSRVQAQSNAEETFTSPPPNLPVKVETSFYLVDLVTIDEKAETFLADVYFSFKWNDPRLVFGATDHKPKVYLEERAAAILKEIWWPQIEFLTASLPIYNNRSVFIFPDGDVEYYIAVTGNFRTRFDFKRFPFDTQTLDIKIDSFLWDKNILEFVPAKGKVLFHKALEDTRNEASILRLHDIAGTTPGPILENLGNTSEYSTYEVVIETERKYGFFVYQIFIPLFLVLGIACTVFFAHKEPFLDRIMVSLTAFLVFIATKFMINQDLPQIGYMTFIDKIFVVSYICIGVTVAVSVLEKLWSPKNEKRAKKLDELMRLITPITFILLFILLFFLE
ncbi:MAG: hypothetical protein HYX48_05250 [Chlamydiales bacterium]|nr:hypothetical protein [Chlamydiales bacterium]